MELRIFCRRWFGIFFFYFFRLYLVTNAVKFLTYHVWDLICLALYTKLLVLCNDICVIPKASGESKKKQKKKKKEENHYSQPDFAKLSL